MSTSDEQERASQLARLWQGSVVPVEDEAKLEARADRMVGALGDAIERSKVRQRKDQGRNRIVVALGLAAAVALAIGVNHYARDASGTNASAVASTDFGGVRAVSGVVTLRRDQQPSVVDRAVLEPGDRVETAAAARAEVKLGELVFASISGSSELGLSAPHATTQRMRLDRGRLDAKVDDRPSPLPKLVVETPDVEVVVTGTVFQVDVTRGGATDSVTEVAVTKGRVEIRRGGAVLAAVSAGEKWSSAVREPAPVEAVDVAQPEVAAPKQPAENIASLSGTLAAENALFQSAVDARNRGNYYVAIDHLDDLLASYPRSPLVAEVRVERMRALDRLGRTREATREAERYLAAFPNGYARREAERLLSPTDPQE